MNICPLALIHAKEKLGRKFQQLDGVEKAADMDNAFSRSPALFIIPLRTKPHGRPIDNGTRFPRYKEQFSADIMMNTSGRARLLDLHTAVTDAFQGACLAICERQIQWLGGKMLHSGGGKLVWENIFETIVTSGDKP